MRKFDWRALLTAQVSPQQIYPYVQDSDQYNRGGHNKPPKQEIADVQSCADAEVSATDNRASCAILVILRVAFD